MGLFRDVLSVGTFGLVDPTDAGDTEEGGASTADPSAQSTAGQETEQNLADSGLDASGNGAQQTTYFRTLFQNSQLALINLSTGTPDAGPVNKGNKRCFTHAEHTVGATNSFHEPTRPAKWVTGYRLVCPIFSDAGYPPDLQVSSMVTKPQVVNRFFTFKLSAAQKAVLVPKIRIFKLEYQSDGEGELKRPVEPVEGTDEVPNPVEIIFDAYILTEQVDLLAENQGGRLSATGIEGFEWTLQGVNPGEVDNNIEASLKIHFNNVSDVFLNNLRQRQLGPGRPGESSFMDLIVFAPAASRDMSDPKTSSLKCPDRKYEGNYFEIRVDVGWQVPPANTGLFTEAERDYIREAQESLFLQLTDHAFDFQEDGSATLTANYRARSAMVDDKYDLLRYGDVETGPKSTIADHQGNIEKMKTELQDLSGESAGGQKTKRQVELESLIKEAEKDLGGFLDEKYKVLVKELLTKHVYSCYVPYTLLLQQRTNLRTGGLNLTDAGHTDDGGTLFDFNLQGNTYGGQVYDAQRFNTTVLGELGAGKAEGNQFAGSAARPLQEAYKHAYKNMKIFGPHALKSGADAETFRSDAFIREKLLDPEAEDITTPTATARGSADGKVGETEKGDDTSAAEYGPLIQYFYLGDILEVFLTKQAVVSDINHKRRAFILTDIEFINPRMIYKKLEAEPITSSDSSAAAATWDNYVATRATLPAGLVRDASPTPEEHFGMSKEEYVKANIVTTETGDFHAPKLKGLPKNSLKCAFKGLTPAQRTQITSRCNIANIPINVELFLDFLKRQIIAKQRTTYFLEDFLRDISTHFVKPVFSQTGVAAAPSSAPITYTTNVPTDKGVPLLWGNVALGYPAHTGMGGGAGAMTYEENRLNDVLTGEAAEAAIAAAPPPPTVIETATTTGGEVIAGTAHGMSYLGTAERLIESGLVGDVKALYDDPSFSGVGDVIASGFSFTKSEALEGNIVGATVISALGTGEAAVARTAEEGVQTKALEDSIAATKELKFSTAAGYIVAAFQNVYLWSSAEGPPEHGAGTPTTTVAGVVSQHRSFTKTPRPGADTACELKIISFQNYFGSYKGTYDDNEARGIPNFVVGLDRGVIKSVQFERVDQPMLREARTAKSKSATAMQLRELYNVTLTLYGNTLLKPGQIIYVEPNRIIFGKPSARNSVARILGLGGYHLVIDVSNVINKEGWETVIKALHVAMPYVSEYTPGADTPESPEDAEDRVAVMESAGFARP